MNSIPIRSKLRLLAAGLAMLAMPRTLHADESGERERSTGQRLATGQRITPLAIPGAKQQPLNPQLPGYPNFVAGMAVRSRLSPDGNTLAVLCAGHNSLVSPPPQIAVDAANSTQYIFLYDVSGSHRGDPQLTQVIKQTNSHVGLVFSPSGERLYATGGRDDAVYAYAKSGASWTQTAKIDLKHGKSGGLGLFGVSPNASGLGISADGKTLVVANNYNDSVSVIDAATGTVRYEHDLRAFFPGNEAKSGGVGGTFPLGVVVKGNGIAYVSSDRDREVVVLDISAPTAAKLIKRIPLDGNGQGMTLDASGSRLYVAQDNADQVAVIDTASNTVVAKIDARGPAGLLRGPGGDDDGDEDGDRGRGHGKRRGVRYTGAATFAVTLSPDGRTLYAVNSGANSIAVIPLHGEHANRVAGLIPTAYDPHDITLSADGSWMYIINGKSVTGPNTGYLAGNTSVMTHSYPGGPGVGPAASAAAFAKNQYQFQLERASLVSAPVPGRQELEGLTWQVAENNFYGADHEHDREVMESLRKRIKHVIYVVKENRTFDQILGDLGNGSNGDPSLTQFREDLTPNFHKLARRFVTLDNFTDPGDGSMDGWSWGMQGRVTNTETITQQINYAFVDRGLSYESEGTNRNVPVNWDTVAGRNGVGGPPGNLYSLLTAGLPGGTDNLLPGGGNHASADAPSGVQEGYIFNAAINAGKSVRNYGFLVNNIGKICKSGKFADTSTGAAPGCSGGPADEISDPFAASEVQVAPLDPDLASLTDLYFRGYDQNYPDLWRYNEWKREFDQYVAHGNLPELTLLRVSHDHTGSFGTALAGVNTPETQQADDDLAVGLVVQAVANSRYAKDTVIIVTEDDCQDGPDHVDSHRATAYVVGAYVKRGAVISTPYSQVSALRTIEDLLGAEHLNLNTAFQRPMTEVFDLKSKGEWHYTAEASTILATTRLAAVLRDSGVRYVRGPMLKPQHDYRYWAEATKGFDFSGADQVPTAEFNRILWKGLMGGRPYPALVGRTGERDD